MIKLYGFGAAFGTVDPSPFVIKVDCFMRMAGIDFELIGSVENLQKAPKGKLPFIEDNGKILADSHFIIKYLTEKYSVKLDDNLSDEQNAQAYLIGKSLDEHVYFLALHSRWIREDTWPMISETFFSGMPFPLRYIIPKVARKKVIKNLYHQGSGRHNDADLQIQFKQSMQAMSDFLGEKDFFFGERVVSFDATAYAFLAVVISAKINNPFNDIARSFDNLKAYCRRIEKKFY